jgi:multifunctional methyltransferase subunit TRM112
LINSRFSCSLSLSFTPTHTPKALVDGAKALDYTDLPQPSEVTEALKSDDAFLRKVHHALLDRHLMEGKLICPETSRPYPVKQGIPNMLLHEDEV